MCRLLRMGQRTRIREHLGCHPGARSCARGRRDSDRVQSGYMSSGTGGYARPLLELANRPVSSENAPARAREWTRVPYLSFPRNEGVPGSSPGIGFRLFCRACFFTGNAADRSAGTKRVHLLTGSWLVKWSAPTARLTICRHFELGTDHGRFKHARTCPRGDR
jgi:hypothetical protein